MSSAEPRLPRFFNLRSKSSRQVSYVLLFTLLLALVLFAHTFQLDRIPTGLFFDESTIGSEAGAISQKGLEPYGGKIPIYFKSDADYDSPILIYTTALIFKLLGVSEYTLRLPNALFFASALLLTIWLATGLFIEHRWVWVYLLVAFGFLPQFFTFSRISFEVISQLACTAAACLGIWRTFHHEGSILRGYINASLCGLVIGISTYTYSTTSLLSALMLASVWVIYFSWENIKKLLSISGACLVALIPYIIFTLNNPGALTSRFHEISFVFDPIPFANKIGIFFSNYSTYWSPSFLLLRGDLNLRHSTGQGGIVYFAVGILFIAGLSSILFEKNLNQFKLLLVLNMLFSPVAAALTSEGIPHAVRSLLLGYYILLISCYGLKYLLEFSHSRVRIFSIACVSILLLYEVTNYQVDYFFRYPARSVDAMGSYDLKGSLEFAIEENPKEIILFDNFAGGLYNFQFYELVVANPNHIPILAAPAVTPTSGACIIYHRLSGAEEELDKYPLAYTEFRSRTRPSELEKRFGAKPFSGVIKARCYQDTQ